MASAAAQFSRPLQRKLQEAGLQGCVGADAFKRLLQYTEDVGGSLDSVHEILDILKTCAHYGRGTLAPRQPLFLRRGRFKHAGCGRCSAALRAAGRRDAAALSTPAAGSAPCIYSLLQRPKGTPTPLLAAALPLAFTHKQHAHYTRTLNAQTHTHARAQPPPRTPTATTAS